MKSKRRLFLTLVFLVPLIFIFSQCLIFSHKTDPRGELFAGSATCIQCHREVYSDYLHTAHFYSTRLADVNNIHGDFSPGHNVYYFSKDLKVVMEKHKDAVYQTAYFKGKMIKSARFDIAFGGTKAESYLYWKGNELYQLPMSYFNALHSWTNSPGFDTLNANYGRMIGTRCFECHSSYIKQLPSESQNLHRAVEYDKSSLILGVDCERCHGPAAKHVEYQLANPAEKKAMYITTYASLARGQRLDMCGVCHSGNKAMITRDIFTFKPGDSLANFKEYDPYQPAVDSTKLDVHGNQNQLLASSQCFIHSKMDCATCHNVHVNQRLDLAIFSQKCMDCHTAAKHNFCKLAPVIGGIIKNNCIDCHMPARSSSVIAVHTSGAKGSAVPYLVRTHHIAVYADATRQVLDNLKKPNKLQAN